MTTKKGRILVADDEESMRLFLVRMLSREGYEVTEAADGLVAKGLIENGSFDLLLTDLRMPKFEGMALLAWIQDQKGRLPVIVMTGYGTIPSAIEALKTGAENYVTKPFEKSEILKAVDAALETGRLAAENKRLKKLLEEGRTFGQLIGSSAPMRSLFDKIDAVANRSGTVLIQGESGTGKELVARAIHQRSDRAGGPFVAVHLGAIPANLVSSELFGVTKGAYTGATADRMGSVERATGGTLFLDEIGDASLDVQIALLRLLEAGEMTPVGSSVTTIVDTRIVAATNRALPAMVGDNKFRQDLYYRLHVFALDVPPLRRRKEDLTDLIRHFLALNGEDDRELPLALLAILQSHNWPGNVRELENVIERMLALSGGGELSKEHLPPELLAAKEKESSESAKPLKAAVAEFEKAHIEDVLSSAAGNVSAAARQLEVSRPTLHGKILMYRIDPDLYR
ncbi:MAG: DNA-binding NtrC family response regulator [Planctomycetota bacterium]